MSAETYFPKWEDEVVESYVLMGSPYPIATLIGSYLVIIIWLGPRLMRNHKPFDLKYVMIAYNAFQVLFNIWIIYTYIDGPGFVRYAMDEACYPKIPTRNKTYRLHMLRMVWFWQLSKLSDLIDTVFIVLRKKHSRMSFLHLYHHTHMACIVWFFMKFVRGEQGVLVAVLNSAVHVVMYSYYLLAALGPRVQPYLWWKKYITLIQLFFVFLMVFSSLVLMCPLPLRQSLYNTYCILQFVIFASLFANFYSKSYKNSCKKNSKTPHSGSAALKNGIH